MTFGVGPGSSSTTTRRSKSSGMLLPTGAIAEEQDVLTLRAFVQDVFDVTLATP
jgi:hypothetical protein